MVPEPKSFFKGYLIGSIGKGSRKGSSAGDIIFRVFLMMIILAIVGSFVPSLIIGFIVTHYIGFDGLPDNRRLIYILSSIFGFITYLIWGSFVLTEIFGFEFTLASISIVLSIMGVLAGVFGALIYEHLFADPTKGDNEKFTTETAVCDPIEIEGDCADDEEKQTFCFPRPCCKIQPDTLPMSVN